MTKDPQSILSQGAMRPLQIAAVALCILLNALDGFDVLAISFASPGIASEWGIDRAALGLVLSMELIGMAAGSLVLGNVADRIGRRPTVLGCLVIMAGGMGMATLANSVIELSAIRLVTGLGIGGMLACTNALVAEFSNDRHRNLAVAIMAAGYPMGAIIGGSIATNLLADGHWRDVFTFGAIITAVFLPIAWLLLPESIGYLAQKRGPNALERINATLRRFGHEIAQALPPAPEKASKVSVAQLFAPGLARVTIVLTLAYFCHIMTFYYIIKWIPKIVVDMGYVASKAGDVLVWANVGGLLGAALLSVLTYRFGVRALVIAAMLASTVLVSLFGQEQETLTGLAIVAAAAGFCTNAAVVGLYALFAKGFPTSVRAGGTGFAIGIGRGGAALGPIVAGLLFNVGLSLGHVSLLMAMGSLIGAGALLFLKEQGE
ncbi:MFS transporter [Novosphingobium sp. KN65.2]|uniref:MFS transporter n=1 Tax=Novosphingobium sp. KN65.2 TaxID=1478134 RepID=UPI0005DEE109|nr:MFS transporter [Novosphingobium sp. KN65.2]CDO35207.1 Major facilitator superfamily protein [Novosphingobium sp. KN65.2]